jgi:hypothetical protein
MRTAACHARSKHLAYQTDPNDVSAQIDLLGVPRLISGVEPPVAQIGGQFCARERRSSQGGTRPACKRGRVVGFATLAIYVRYALVLTMT